MEMNAHDQHEVMDKLFESDLRPAQYWAMKAEERIRIIASGRRMGYSTGLKCLDNITRIRKEDLVIIGAHSSMGKTALALQITREIVSQIQADDDDGIVAIFSAEMTGDSLMMRFAGDMTGIPMQDYEDRRLPPEKMTQATNQLLAAIDKIRADSFWIDDNTSPTVAQMKAQIKRLTETIPVRAVIFDFLELASSEARSQEERISDIAKNLKAMAKELHIPVVALSQLNDDANKRDSKMPQASDLRYSKAIHHISDVIILLMRPEYYLSQGIPVTGFNSLKEAEGKAFFNVAKQRNGRTGIVEGVYLKERMRFADVARVPLMNGEYQ